MLTTAVWAIAIVTVACIIVRPLRVPEAVPAVIGALVLVAFGLLRWSDAVTAIRSGSDVYCFLLGMMLVAEVARVTRVFEWLAAFAAQTARGSRRRLFALVYGVGTVVTIFLSNDATAVVLTPAVAAVVARTGAPALPYLFACAFIANAASFVLPISNPANLVVFAGRVPALLPWLAAYAIPSILAIALTYLALRAVFGKELAGRIDGEDDAPPQLGRSGRVATGGAIVFAIALVVTSLQAGPLGAVALVTAIAVYAAVALTGDADAARAPWHLSWQIVPLVAGLFVIVRALDASGAVALAAGALQHTSTWPAPLASVVLAFCTALLANLANNLPVGLLAGTVLAAHPVAAHLVRATLIGVDLGPNLSVTGSLATLLWLVALRREGLDVSALRFLRVGAVVMTPALLAAALAAGLRFF